MRWTSPIIDAKLTPNEVRAMLTRSLDGEEMVQFIKELLYDLDEKHQEQFKAWLDEWWGDD